MAHHSIFHTAYAQVRQPIALIVFLLCATILSAIYPSVLDTYLVRQPGSSPPVEVTLTEHYLRYVPTGVQIALPLLLGDKVGAVQLFYVAVSTTVVTHGVKQVLKGQWVGNTRLDQRPNGGSKNMPSGHSSMASCAVYFVGRRYRLWLGVAFSLIVVLTMYARVMLNAHTISAVIAGALIGCMTAAWFTSPRGPPQRLAPWFMRQSTHR